jgi:hypothetical protein
MHGRDRQNGVSVNHPGRFMGGFLGMEELAVLTKKLSSSIII